MASGPRWNLASYRERLTQDTVKPTTVAQRVEEFRRDGYTVFRGFNTAWIERWRPVFMDHYRRQLGQDQRGSGVGQARAVLRGLLQEYPDLFLPSLVAPEMLDFLEALMGPTVGFDSLQIAITPPVGEREAHDVHAWHRDMWALTGWTDDYLPPNAVNVLTYLQEGPKYGQLRVIPGSHRGSRVVGAGGAARAQEDQQVVPAAAGDTVVIHSSLLHTTSGNHSGNLRIFASFFYTRAWLPKRESYGDAGMQRVIRAARGHGDRRVARLFEPDGELLAHRFNGNNGEHTEQQRWRQWLAEERAERQRAAAAREKAADGAAVQDAASPQPQAAPPTAGAGIGTAGKTNAAPGAAPDTAAGNAAGNAPAAAGPAGAAAAAVPVLNARAELGEGPGVGRGERQSCTGWICSPASCTATGPLPGSPAAWRWAKSSVAWCRGRAVACWRRRSAASTTSTPPPAPRRECPPLRRTAPKPTSTTAR